MIARLALTDFRNHASALLEAGPGFVMLSGDNGAGKTNILEAVSLLSPGRGPAGSSEARASSNLRSQSSSVRL